MSYIFCRVESGYSSDSSSDAEHRQLLTAEHSTLLFISHSLEADECNRRTLSTIARRPSSIRSN